VIISDNATSRSYLRLADLVSGQVNFLSEEGAPVDDSRAIWRPQGDLLAVARRDEQVARGYQIYALDPVDRSASLLTDDPRYTNMFFWWDPTGTQLVVHRFPEFDENGMRNVTGKPEVWTLDAQTRELTFVAEDGMLPQWVP
jgi:hypothetical protein